MTDIPKPDGVSQADHEKQLRGIAMRCRGHPGVVR